MFGGPRACVTDHVDPAIPAGLSCED